MIVIADTSPLHYLILLQQTDILQQAFGRVIVPGAVARELAAQRAPAAVKQWIENPPQWFETREIEVPADPALDELDAGEREAIALAEFLHADALILDEKAGRREAQRRNLRVIGTGILDDAAAAGLLELATTLERLQNLGFYLDATLKQVLLDRDLARRKRLE